jgi:hypothetical protein
MHQKLQIVETYDNVGESHVEERDSSICDISSRGHNFLRPSLDDQSSPLHTCDDGDQDKAGEGSNLTK